MGDQLLTERSVRLCVDTRRISLMDQAETILVRAMESGQLSAAVSALKEKGVLSGKRIERREVGGPGEFETMTDEGLERAIAERVMRLGLTHGRFLWHTGPL